MDFPGFPAQLRSWVGEAQLLQLRRLELRRLEGTHGAEQRCAMLQARCRSLEQDLETDGFSKSVDDRAIYTNI